MILLKHLKTIGIVFLAMLVFWLFLTQSASKNVKMAIVRRGLIRNSFSLTGQTAVAQKETVISKYEGKVQEFLVTEGNSVKALDKLLIIGLADFENSLQKAEAAYTKAKATVQKINRSVNYESIKLAENQLTQAKSTQELAQGRFDKACAQLEAAKQGTNSKSAKDSENRVRIAGTTLVEAVRKVEVAKRNLALIKKAVIPRELVEAERAQKRFEMELNELHKTQGQGVVYASINGRVVQKYVEAGAPVRVGDRLMEVEDSESAYIRSELPADAAGKVRLGQKVLISGAVLNGNVIEGSVDYHKMLDNPGSSSGAETPIYEVRVKYNTAQNILRTGQSVDLQFIVQEADGVMYIPKQAVFKRFGRTQVFV
ncbi:MAG TPA: HlyD family efflux transporter periplasmic adaptor subunit, partial [Bacillota bacterium]|nr:HlyD family efflux transporter periplasmic adaptor subunit [Bacillota bacterium]